MNRTIRKTFNLWIAWRARKRLRSVKGWQKDTAMTYETTMNAIRACHPCEGELYT